MNKRLRSSEGISLLTLAVAGLSVAPFGASAQTSASSATVSVEPSVAEVVVTAQKRSERLVDVPISVAAVSANQLQQAGITDVMGLTQLVPGLRFDLQGAFVQPSIRGVNSSVAGPGLAAPIATYVDGFYYPDEIGANFELPDVASVEVSKGPQGTLFGRNATGGAISITTKAPSFSPEGIANLSYGNYNEVLGSLYVSGPLTDKLAASLMIEGHRSDGFDHDLVTGRRQGDYDTEMYRGKLLWEPDSSTQATLTLSHGHINNPNVTLFDVYEGQSAAAAIPGAIVPVERGQVANNVPSVNVTDTWAAYLKIKKTFSWATLTSYSAYQTFDQPRTGFDVDATTAPLEAVPAYPEVDRVYTQEFDLNGHTHNFDWVTGAFYMHQDAGFYVSILDDGGAAGGSGPITRVIESKQVLSSYALFGDATWNPIDKLYLTAGARYNIDDLNEAYDSVFTGYKQEYDYSPGVGPCGVAVCTQEPKTQFSGFTPRGVIRYEFADNSNVYASISRGSKSGVYDSPGLNPNPIKPEEITAYELGVKTAQSRWSFDAAAFYYDYTNLQVTSYVGLATIIQNAATARIYGADAHFVADLTGDIRLDLGGEYLHSRYGTFLDAPEVLWDPVTKTLNSFSANASGNTIPRSPSFSGNVGLTYHHELLAGRLELNVNYSYQTKVNYDQFGNVQQTGYGLLNLRAAWTTPNGKWTVAAYGKNVTDQVYLVQLTQQPFSNDVSYGWPTTYGLQLTARF